MCWWHLNRLCNYFCPGGPGLQQRFPSPEGGYYQSRLLLCLDAADIYDLGQCRCELGFGFQVNKLEQASQGWRSRVRLRRVMIKVWKEGQTVAPISFVLLKAGSLKVISVFSGDLFSLKLRNSCLTSRAATRYKQKSPDKVVKSAYKWPPRGGVGHCVSWWSEFVSTCLNKTRFLLIRSFIVASGSRCLQAPRDKNTIWSSHLLTRS